MRRAAVSVGLVAAIWCGSCGKSTSNSIVVVTVTPAPSAPAVTQLIVVLINSGLQETKYFPQINSTVPIKFNASFAVTFPKSRSGELKIEIDALDASSTPVASGNGRAAIVVGGRADVVIPPLDREGADGGIPDSGLGDVVPSATETGATDARIFPDATIPDVLSPRDSGGLGGNRGAGGANSTGALDGGGGGMTGTGGLNGGGGGITGTGGTTLGAGGSGTGGLGAGGTATGAGGSGGLTVVDAGRGGNSGGTGGAATGGTTGGHDAATTIGDAGSNCFSKIASNGYTCGSTPACSACKDQDGNTREAGCTKAIDCLAAAGASCNSSCKQNCLNLAGDSPGMACVTSFQTACSGSGC
jgi:uncharacterized membrane protein YgcG